MTDQDKLIELLDRHRDALKLSMDAEVLKNQISNLYNAAFDIEKEVVKGLINLKGAEDFTVQQVLKGAINLGVLAGRDGEANHFEKYMNQKK